jgi:Tfp pilus assembly PilM family ATPase
LTQLIAKSLSVDSATAEKLKQEKGLDENASPNIKKVLLPLIDYILSETDKILKNFTKEYGIEVEKIILGGGSAQMPGFKKYFSEFFNKETETADPFKDIFYPPILEDTFKKIGSSYSVATGMALRGLELE